VPNREQPRWTGSAALVLASIGVVLGAGLELWGWHQVGDGPRGERGLINIATGVAVMVGLPAMAVARWRRDRRR